MSIEEKSPRTRNTSSLNYKQGERPFKTAADRNGNVVARFEPTADMEKVEAKIAELF